MTVLGSFNKVKSSIWLFSENSHIRNSKIDKMPGDIASRLIDRFNCLFVLTQDKLKGFAISEQFHYKIASFKEN